MWILEKRLPALAGGQIFIDFDERATITESQEAAYVAWITPAFGRATGDRADWGPLFPSVERQGATQDDHPASCSAVDRAGWAERWLRRALAPAGGQM